MDNLITKTRDVAIDEFEALISKEIPVITGDLTHTFLPGMYVRELKMPADSIWTSKIHKTEHPFVVLTGKVHVSTKGGFEEIIAPYFGVTKPGTRRVLLVEEECTWLTFHATQKETVEEIEMEIIEEHDNPLLSDEVKQIFNTIKKKEDISWHGQLSA